MCIERESYVATLNLSKKYVCVCFCLFPDNINDIVSKMTKGQKKSGRKAEESWKDKKQTMRDF